MDENTANSICCNNILNPFNTSSDLNSDFYSAKGDLCLTNTHNDNDIKHPTQQSYTVLTNVTPRLPAIEGIEW